LTALDINRDAGALIGGGYASVIDLRYGDSICLLAASASPADLFLHDSDHYDHESVEYRPVAGAPADHWAPASVLGVALDVAT
jgi:hypothetical protein